MGPLHPTVVLDVLVGHVKVEVVELGEVVEVAEEVGLVDAVPGRTD